MHQDCHATSSRTWLCGLCCSSIAALSIASVAAARPDAPSKLDNGPTLDDLLKRIDSLERSNKSLEGQVSELKALEGEKWLSQERAEQIRGIVSDVISDADARASLRQDAMTAGWNDGFFLASPDGRFKLQMTGLLQPRFMWSHVRDSQVSTVTPTQSTPYIIPDPIEDRYGFDSQYNELTFKGHVFSPAIEYMVRTNVAMQNSYAVGTSPDNSTFPTLGSNSGTLYLLDAWVRIGLSDEWSIRFGQYRSPYAREQLVTESNQMAVSRSTIVRNFGLWYTQGIEFQYQGDDFRWDLSVDNGGSSNIAGTTLHLVGTEPANAAWYTQQSSYSVTTRLEWKPYGSWADFNSMTSPMGEQQGMLVGLAFHTQGTRPNIVSQDPSAAPYNTVGNDENYWDSVTADAQWNFGGASFFMSGFWNYVNSQSTFATSFDNASLVPPAAGVGIVNAYGVVLQPAIYIAPKWEAYTRMEYGYIDFNDSSGLAGASTSIQQVAKQKPYTVVTMGLNWYIDGQDLKWTFDMGFNLSDLDYSWQNLPAGWRISGTDQIVMRTQLQLMF